MAPVAHEEQCLCATALRLRSYDPLVHAVIPAEADRTVVIQAASVRSHLAKRNPEARKGQVDFFDDHLAIEGVHHAPGIPHQEEPTGVVGGAVEAHRQGGAADPELGYVFVGSATNPAVVGMVENDPPPPGPIPPNYTRFRMGGRGAPQIPFGLRPFKPPYGRITAYDMNRGEIAWKVPFGEGSPLIRRHPLLRDVDLPARLGTPGNNGPMATAGGIVLIGGGERYLYAFDAATGREVTRVPTELRTSGNPMSYVTGTGRQFIVIATGAGPDASLVAFALPEEG